MATFDSNLDAVSGGGGGGGEDLAATLALGNLTGGTDVELTAGDAFTGASGVSAGDNGEPVVVSPGAGVVGTAASGVLTVNTAPVTAGYQIDIGRTPYFFPYLTAVDATRTPSSNDFDGRITPATALAAEIVAAINDVANSYDTFFVAADNFDGTITVTRLATGSFDNSTTLDGNPSGDVTGTGFSGGITDGANGAFQLDKAGDARGAGAVDFQTERTVSTQVASGARSMILGGFNNTNSAPLAIVHGLNNSLTDPGELDFSFSSMVFGESNTVVVGGGFAQTLLMGFNNDFDMYSSGGSIANSIIFGNSNEANPAYYSYLFSSVLQGFSHYLHHGGLNVAAVFGGSHAIGAYVEQTLVAGGGHNLGSTSTYYSLSGSLVWGVNHNVAHAGDVWNSSIGGFDVKTEAPSNLNLGHLNVWGGGTHATIYGEVVWANESSARQGSMLQMQNLTSNGSLQQLVARISAFGGYNRLYTIRLDQAHRFVGTVIAHEPATGDTKSWDIEGLIKNIGGTTTMVGSSVIVAHADAGAAAWTVAVVADNTGDYLRINVTGEAAHTIQWNSFIWGPHAGTAT